MRFLTDAARCCSHACAGPGVGPAGRRLGCGDQGRRAFTGRAQSHDTPGANTRPPELDYPKIEIPEDLRPDPKIPPLELSKQPDPGSVPKAPAVGAAKDMVIPAIPSAAPASGSEPLIPPPSLPTLPDPARRDPLPSLTLPPEVPVAPEKKPDSISRSSPLTRGGASGIKVEGLPNEGGGKPGGRLSNGGLLQPHDPRSGIDDRRAEP